MHIALYSHRRRMETEGKAKVVASVCGAHFFNSFLPRLLFCLGLFGRNGCIQPVYLEETVEFLWKYISDRGQMFISETPYPDIKCEELALIRAYKAAACRL